MARLDVWWRRYWRTEPTQLAAFDGLTPFVVVTGGSEGIGKALADRFAADGASVLLVARSAETLQAAAAELSRPGARIATLALDIRADNAVDMLDAALARLGGYADVLVNSAAVGHAGAFIEQDPAALAALLDLDIKALTMLTRHVLPDMVRRGRGGVLNVASLGSYAPGPHQATYYAAKAYVISLGQAIGYETRGQGVRVTTLVPGPVATAFHARMGAGAGWYLRLLPVASAGRVAAAGYRGFRWRRRVVVPGVFNPLLMAALRLLPQPLTMPLVSWLIRPRAPGSTPARG